MDATNTPTTKDPPPFLPKTLGKWLVLGILVVLIAIFIWPPGPWREPDTRSIQEYVNIRQVAIALHAYTSDYRGKLPDHVSRLHIGADTYILETTADQVFISPYDSDMDVTLTVPNDTPEEWYQYGSFYFYPTAGIAVDDISDPTKFVVVYAPPRNEDNLCAVGYLNGTSERLPEDELHAITAAQEDLIIRSSNDVSPEANP